MPYTRQVVPYKFYPGENQQNRDAYINQAMGLGGATWPLHAGMSTGATGTQDIRATLSGFKDGDVLTNLYLATFAAAVTVTHFQMGVLDLSGNVLAKTADSASDRTALQSIGIVGATITQDGVGNPITNFTIPGEGAYYLASSWAATTGPQVHRSNSPGVGPNGLKTAISVSGNASGLLGSVVSLATALTVPCWYGWS